MYTFTSKEPLNELLYETTQPPLPSVVWSKRLPRHHNQQRPWAWTRQSNQPLSFVVLPSKRSLGLRRGLNLGQATLLVPSEGDGKAQRNGKVRRAGKVRGDGAGNAVVL